MVCITHIKTSIPLHCNICPKKPDFSDVSHLLTHIGSKGHLSNYFTLKVKSTTHPISKRTLDQYDQWYEDWNVQDLMSERYDQKERKKVAFDRSYRSNARTGTVALAMSPITHSPELRHSTIGERSMRMTTTT